MAGNYYIPPEESTARQLTRAILRAKADLDPKLAAQLSPDIAWSLGVVLASWRAAHPLIDLRSFPDIGKQLDNYADTLERLREAASAAKSDLDLAGATGLFLSVVRQIGPGILRYVLTTRPFARISQEVLRNYPVPSTGELASAAEKAESRSRRYTRFDYRSRSEEEPSITAPPSEVEIGQWQAQLKRADLSPEMRWLLEQKLLSANKPGYASAAEARKQWEDARAKATSDEIRAYFGQNLLELKTV